MKIFIKMPDGIYCDYPFRCPLESGDISCGLYKCDLDIDRTNAPGFIFKCPKCLEENKPNA